MNIKKLLLFLLISAFLISIDVLKTTASANNTTNQKTSVSTNHKTAYSSKNNDANDENTEIITVESYSLVEDIEENLTSKDIDNIDDNFGMNISNDAIKIGFTNIPNGNIQGEHICVEKNQIVQFDFTLRDVTIDIYDSNDNIMYNIPSNKKGTKKIKFNQPGYCYVVVKGNEDGSSYYTDIKWSVQDPSPCEVVINPSPSDDDNKDKDSITTNSSKTISILEAVEEDLDSEYINSVETGTGYYESDFSAKNSCKFNFSNFDGKAQRIIGIGKGQNIQLDYTTILKSGKNLHIDICDRENNLVCTFGSNKKGSIKLGCSKLGKLYLYVYGDNTNCLVDIKWSITSEDTSNE